MVTVEKVAGQIFSQAAKPEKAHQLYQVFINQLLQLGVDVKTGEFQATMEVELTNDGPITILLDSKSYSKTFFVRW